MLFNFICILFGVFSIIVISRPKHIFKYLMLAYALNTIVHAYSLNSTVIAIGGISIYLADLPIIVMVALFLLKGGRIRKSMVAAVMFFVFFMVTYSAVVGILSYGINRYYLSDIRIFLSMIVPIIYFYNCPCIISDDDIRFANKIIAAMVGFCYLCWGLYITTGIKLSSSNAAGGFRVWGATGAIIIAFATLCYIYDDVIKKQRKFISLRTLLCVIAIVILQHNSVWAALGIGSVIMLIIEGVNRKDILRFCFQIALVFGIFLLVISSMPNNPIVQAILSTTEKYNEMGTGEGTIGGRQLIWEGYLQQLSRTEWFVGKPMGTGWLVNFKGSYSLNPPHNAYIQGVMRIGLLGTVSLFALLVVSFLKNFLEKNSICASIILASLVYLYAYMFSLEMSSVWGCLIGLTYGSIDYIRSNQYECG